MTYDDDSEWRRDDRPSWRRDRLPPPGRLRDAPPRPPLGAPLSTARRDDRPPANYEPRPPAVPSGDDATVGDIAAMVERIVSQLDAADRIRAVDTGRRAADRRPEPPPHRSGAVTRAPRAGPPGGAASGVAEGGNGPADGHRPFTEALRQHLREKARSEPHDVAAGEPTATASAPPHRPARSGDPVPPPLASDIDRHFRALAARVDAVRQRSEDGIAAVREDVARLAEAVRTRPPVGLAPVDRAALDALAARLDRLDAFAPETTGRLAALQADMTALGRAVTDLDIDRRLHAVEAGQDAVLERLHDARGADPAVDALRRRIDWIAERLETSPAADAVAALDTRLARLAGEVKTAAREAGAETLPLVADLARRIENLDRRLDDLAHPGPVARPAAPSWSAAADGGPADTRLADARPAAAAPAPAPVPPAVAPELPPAAPTRTTRLIAAARRAVEHPVLRRGSDPAGAEPVADAATPPPAPPEPRVVALADHRPAAPEPDVFAPAPPPAGNETPVAAGGLGGRRLVLLAAAALGLVAGAYGLASEPLRALVASLSGSETTSTVAGRVPSLLDPQTTGSIRPAGAPPAAAFTMAPAPAPTAASLPATLGSPGLREAAAGGDPRAALEVAVALLDGVGVTRDPAAAVAWLTVAADAGLAPAEFRLGTLHERGIGVVRSRETAKTWYDRAAGRGHVKAMHNLAVLLAEAGDGRDMARAVTWFETAARHGLVDSQFNLAVLHERGLGVAADPAAAYRWFALAALQGDQEAATRRDDLGRTLAPADRTAADLAVASWTAVPTDALANEGPPLPQQWTAARTAGTRG